MKHSDAPPAEHPAPKRAPGRTALADRTAAEIVALATRAAKGASPLTPGRVLFVDVDANVWNVIPARDFPDVHDRALWCVLTPENIASEATRVRALAASVIAMRRDPLNAAVFVAVLGERKRAGWTEDEARAALLNAVLGVEVAS